MPLHNACMRKGEGGEESIAETHLNQVSRAVESALGRGQVERSAFVVVGHRGKVDVVREDHLDPPCVRDMPERRPISVWRCALHSDQCTCR